MNLYEQRNVRFLFPHQKTAGGRIAGQDHEESETMPKKKLKKIKVN